MGRSPRIQFKSSCDGDAHDRAGGSIDLCRIALYDGNPWHSLGTLLRTVLLEQFHGRNGGVVGSCSFRSGNRLSGAGNFCDPGIWSVRSIRNSACSCLFGNGWSFLEL